MTVKESPSMYKVKHPDTARKGKTDGGYEYRRRRFTRTPRKMYETGFIGLTHADFEIIETFYLEKLTDTTFTWDDQLRGVTKSVRFDSFEPKYRGFGTYRLWDVKIKLSEV